MQRVGVTFSGYSEETAQEAIDLALAVGLLDIEVYVFVERDALAHLFPADRETLGRWRTLIDLCPARIFVEQGIHWAGAQPEFNVVAVSADERQRLKQSCDRLIQG